MGDKVKHVWVFSQDESTPTRGSLTRHYFIGNELSKYNWHTTLFCASAGHLLIDKPKFLGLYKIEQVAPGVRLVWVKTNRYTKNHGVGRAISWILFMLNLALITPFIKHKPNKIIVSSFPFFSFANAVLLKTFLRRTKKIILEIRDLYPTTLIELAGYSEKNLMIRFLLWFEKWAYRKSDRIVGVLPNIVDRVQQVDSQIDPNKFIWISNGINPEFYENVTPSPVLKSSIDALPNNTFKIGYAGSFNAANALHLLIEIAEESQKAGKPWDFLFLGDGPLRDMVHEAADRLENVHVFPKVEKQQVAAFLQYCDCLYFGVKKLDIYRFGLVPNKVFDYMFSKKPIVMAGKYPPNILEKTNGGILVEAENSEEILRAFEDISGLPETELAAMGERNVKEIKDSYSIPVLASRYQELLDEA